MPAHIAKLGRLTDELLNAWHGAQESFLHYAKEAKFNIQAEFVERSGEFPEDVELGLADDEVSGERMHQLSTDVNTLVKEILGSVGNEVNRERWRRAALQLAIFGQWVTLSQDIHPYLINLLRLIHSVDALERNEIEEGMRILGMEP